jgi:hypothetical protein
MKHPRRCAAPAATGCFAFPPNGMQRSCQLLQAQREPLERILRARSARLKPFLVGPLAQAHHSSALWIFGSTSRGPHTTPMSCQSDGFAASAARQDSVSPFDATYGNVAERETMVYAPLDRPVLIVAPSASISHSRSPESPLF